MLIEFAKLHEEEKEVRHAVKGLDHAVTLLTAVVKQVAGLNDVHPQRGSEG